MAWFCERDERGRAKNSYDFATKVKHIVVRPLHELLGLKTEDVPYKKLADKISSMKDKYQHKLDKGIRTGAGLTEEDILNHSNEPMTITDGDPNIVNDMTIHGMYGSLFVRTTLLVER